MPRKRTKDGLTPRDREILKDIVRTFIVEGTPVSSRTVAKHQTLGLSAASIRNSMADLEEQGLLEQPHASAGRIPTQAGYHLYINSLMKNRKVSVRERRYIDDQLAAGGDPEQLTASASQILSELSNQIGIVMTPDLGETELQAVDFVPLSGSRVLCVVVSGSGFVDNKIIEPAVPLSREELIRISNYVNENFSGRSLRAIRRKLIETMAEERARVDLWFAQALSLAQRALHPTTGPGVLVEGTSSVLAQPELADVDLVRRMFDKFADKARLVALLNQCIEGVGVRVVIGDESDLTSDLDFSLVATTYGRKDQKAFGSLAVFGPSRMEYRRVIPLVDYLGDTLSQALEASYLR